MNAAGSRTALVLLLLALAGCVQDPGGPLVVRNDTDRSLAFRAYPIASLATLGLPAPLLDPADPDLAALGFVLLAPGAEAGLDASSPADGIALVIYVDHETSDGTYAFSDTQTWTAADLRDSDGRIRIVSYRDVG